MSLFWWRLKSRELALYSIEEANIKNQQVIHQKNLNKERKKNNINACCILTFDRARCSTCVNNVITGCTCVDKQRYILWVSTGICRHWAHSRSKETCRGRSAVLSLEVSEWPYGEDQLTMSSKKQKYY